MSLTLLLLENGYQVRMAYVNYNLRGSESQEEEHSVHLYLQDSGGSESASQQAANRELKPMRGRASALQKSWQVLSVALAFSRLESLRDFSPLKRVLISRDWAGAANKAIPSV